MEQPARPAPALAETIDEIFDDVSLNDHWRRIDRPGKDSVIVISMRSYQSLRPLKEALDACFLAANQAGLDGMTMDEINEEIDIVRREMREARRA